MNLFLAHILRWTEDFKRELVSSRVETTQILCRAVRMAEDKPQAYINSSAIGKLCALRPHPNLLHVYELMVSALHGQNSTCVNTSRSKLGGQAEVQNTFCILLH